MILLLGFSHSPIILVFLLLPWLPLFTLLQTPPLTGYGLKVGKCWNSSGTFPNSVFSSWENLSTLMVLIRSLSWGFPRNFLQPRSVFWATDFHSYTYSSTQTSIYWCPLSPNTVLERERFNSEQSLCLCGTYILLKKTISLIYTHTHSVKSAIEKKQTRDCWSMSVRFCSLLRGFNKSPLIRWQLSRALDEERTGVSHADILGKSATSEERVITIILHHPHLEWTRNPRWWDSSTVGPEVDNWGNKWQCHFYIFPSSPYTQQMSFFSCLM